MVGHAHIKIDHIFSWRVRGHGSIDFQGKGGIPAAGNAPPLELKTIDSGSDAAYKDALQGDSIES